MSVTAAVAALALSLLGVFSSAAFADGNTTPSGDSSASVPVVTTTAPDTATKAAAPEAHASAAVAPAESSDPAPAATTSSEPTAPATAPQAARVATDTSPAPPTKTDTQPVKVMICHRTDAVTNPYRSITVDSNAVDGVGKGDHYGEHQGPLASTAAIAQQLKTAHTKWGDIIPPLAGVHAGLNWTTEGQAIYNNDCRIPAPVEPPVVVKQEVGLYIYPLLNTAKAPSWANSGKQIFCESKDGTSWFTTLSCTLPSQVCGTGWGYQQDKVKNWTYDGAFKWPSSIQYPVDNIGWPPIYDAKHGLLSELTTVPDCTPPPVHTQVTPKYDHSVPTCNTETHKVEGANTLVLTGQKGVIWTITKGTDTQTLAAGAGFNGLPPYGVGTYTITGADASSSDLIDVTPVTATLTFVAADSIECATPPVVIAPAATIKAECLAGTPTESTPTPVVEPTLTFTLTAGTYANTFQILVGGVQVEEHAVPAGGTYDGVITLGEDSFGGSTTTEVKSGDVSLTSEIVVSTNCVTPVVIHPVNVWFNDGCGVSDDSTNTPGLSDGPAVVVNDKPNVGDVTTLSSYSSNQGGYNVVDVVTKAGVHTSQVTFVQIGAATIAEPGTGDTYTIVVIDGHRYAQWSYTFDSTPCPLTVIATPPAPAVIPATCTADGSLLSLQDGNGYTAAYDRTFDGPGAYKAVYTAKEGSTFADASTVSYDLTVAPKLTKDCSTVVVTPTDTTGSLAFTGFDAVGPLSAGALLVIIGGLVAFFGYRRSRRIVTGS